MSSFGGGNGNPLQYSCQDNPMDRGTWRASVCGVAKESDMTEQLSAHICNELFGCVRYFIIVKNIVPSHEKSKCHVLGG